MAKANRWNRGKSIGVSSDAASQAVRAIGRRYPEGGLERALEEKQRPAAAPLLQAAQKQRLLAMACSDPPPGRARWTVRLIAPEAVQRKLVPRAGRETIRVLLESHDWKPWRKKMWCLAELEEPYVERMEDLLALYERPYDPAEPEICRDQKPLSLPAEVRPPRAAAPGRRAQRDNEYKRCGTAHVCALVAPQAGRHCTAATPQRAAAECAKRLAAVLDRYPAARTLQLLWDHLNSHCRKSLSDSYGEKQGRQMGSRLTIHPTPQHGRWLQQAEIELSLYARPCLGTRRIPDLASLQRQTRSWTRGANRARGRINWQFDRKTAREQFGYRGMHLTPETPTYSMRGCGGLPADAGGV